MHKILMRMEKYCYLSENRQMNSLRYNFIMEVVIVSKDDLESIGYIAIYLISGKLPWSDIDNSSSSVSNSEMLVSKFFKVLSLKPL